MTKRSHWKQLLWLDFNSLIESKLSIRELSTSIVTLNLPMHYMIITWKHFSELTLESLVLIENLLGKDLWSMPKGQKSAIRWHQSFSLWQVKLHMKGCNSHSHVNRFSSHYVIGWFSFWNVDLGIKSNSKLALSYKV